MIFIPFSAPGDRVRVRLIENHKRYAQAELIEVLEPSPVREKPPCPAFGRCGGCQWQHLPYSLQWKTKLEGVRHALTRVQLTLPGPLEELPAERIWEYRNRVQLRGSGDVLGFYAAASHEVVGVERCEIARPEINALWPAIREKGRGLPPYKVEVEALPGGGTREFWNAKHGAGGFRQVHDDQNEKLRAWVGNALSKGRVLYDLFGGSGNLSLPFVKEMTELHCVDVSAPRSAEGFPPNVRFHRASVARWLLKKKQEIGGKARGPASAVLDPPRIGLGEEFGGIEDALRALEVTELVLVGCDVDAWVRDVGRFVKRGWKVERLAVLDLFPQTPHVESLARLVLS